MTTRKEFIIDLIDNGKTKTWKDYAEEYGFKDEKQANDYWRYYLRTGNIVPFEETTTECEGIPEGAIITKAWGKPDNLSYTYEVRTENSITQEEFRGESIKDLSTFSPTVSKKDFEVDYTKPSIYYEISLPDLHFGKGPLEHTVRNFKQTLGKLVKAVENYNVTEFILPIGNDILNSEGLRRSTTKGTPQFDSADWRETFRTAWQTIVEAIDWLSTKAKCSVFIIQGNHDFERSFYLGDVLYAYYLNNDNVVVDNSMEVRKYYHFGSNLIMYDHGELKFSEYPLIMATEHPREFAASEHKEIHCGHFHKEMVTDEIRGIKVRFMPSICAQDRWHKKNGYLSKRVAQGYKWDLVDGLIGYEQCAPTI